MLKPSMWLTRREPEKREREQGGARRSKAQGRRRQEEKGQKERSKEPLGPMAGFRTSAIPLGIASTSPPTITKTPKSEIPTWVESTILGEGIWEKRKRTKPASHHT